MSEWPRTAPPAVEAVTRKERLQGEISFLFGPGEISFSLEEDEHGDVTIGGDNYELPMDFSWKEGEEEEVEEVINILTETGVIDGYEIEEGEGYEDAPGYSSSSDDWKHVSTYHLNKPLKIEVAKLNAALKEGKLRLETWKNSSNEIRGHFERIGMNK